MQPTDPGQRRARSHWGAWAAIAAVAAGLLTFLNQLPDFFGRTLPWLAQSITLGPVTFAAWQGLLVVAIVTAVIVIIVDVARSRRRSTSPIGRATPGPQKPEHVRSSPRPSDAGATRAVAPPAITYAPDTGTSDGGLRGIALARRALEIFQRHASAYPGGITVDQLLSELGGAGVVVAGDAPASTLSSALNASQPHGVWLRRDRGVWVPGSGASKMESGLAGRPLADALYDFVISEYPSGTFHYEEARVGLEQTGVDVKGTGATTRGALASAADLFEAVPGRNGLWRWKPRGDEGNRGTREG